jgi:hypothetical protein
MDCSRRRLGLLLHVYLFVGSAKEKASRLNPRITRGNVSNFHVAEVTANCFIDNLTSCSSLWALKWCKYCSNITYSVGDTAA